MNTKASVKIGTGAAILLSSLIWTGSVMAQDSKVVANMKQPADNLTSCNAMNWNQEFLGDYPWVAKGCHAVVTVNGEKWARFEGQFKGMNSDGSFDTEFLNTSDRHLGRVALTPQPGQLVTIDDKKMSFSELNRDQILSFYVPEGAMGFAVEPGVPQSQLTTVTPAARAMEVEDKPAKLAVVEPRSAKAATRLPTTAGPLPVVALSGLMLLLGGLGLTIRRKAWKQNS